MIRQMESGPEGKNNPSIAEMPSLSLFLNAAENRVFAFTAAIRESTSKEGEAVAISNSRFPPLVTTAKGGEGRAKQDGSEGTRARRERYRGVININERADREGREREREGVLARSN